jgi:hypothetical protein
MRTSTIPALSAFAALALICVPAAKGALSLTIDVFNSTTLTFTVSGTFDAPTAGFTYPGVIAVSPDEFGATAYFTGDPVRTATTLQIAGSAASQVILGNNTPFAGYAVAFYTDPFTPIPAGTAISGSATFTGNFTSFPTMYLWSGFDNSRDMNRLEATGQVVPEPSSMLLGAIGALALVRRRR